MGRQPFLAQAIRWLKPPAIKSYTKIIDKKKSGSCLPLHTVFTIGMYYPFFFGAGFLGGVSFFGASFLGLGLEASIKKFIRLST